MNKGLQTMDFTGIEFWGRYFDPKWYDVVMFSSRKIGTCITHEEGDFKIKKTINGRGFRIKNKSEAKNFNTRLIVGSWGK